MRAAAAVVAVGFCAAVSGRLALLSARASAHRMFVLRRRSQTCGLLYAGSCGWRIDGTALALAMWELLTAPAAARVR
jgi:hypothetical protein